MFISDSLQTSQVFEWRVNIVEVLRYLSLYTASVNKTSYKAIQTQEVVLVVQAVW